MPREGNIGGDSGRFMTFSVSQMSLRISQMSFCISQMSFRISQMWRRPSQKLSHSDMYACVLFPGRLNTGYSFTNSSKCTQAKKTLSYLSNQSEN